MAVISKKQIGVIPNEVEAEVEQEIPTARVEIKPPTFMRNREPLTPQQELDEARRIIEEGKLNNLNKVFINHDLQDLAWQTLSKEGYKLTRRVLPRLVQMSEHIEPLDPNRIQFEISLTEFNKPYLG